MTCSTPPRPARNWERAQGATQSRARRPSSASTASMAPGARQTGPSRGPSRRSRASTGTPRACESWRSSYVTERASRACGYGAMKGEARRLDALLVARGLADSRSRAQGLILSGSVRVGDKVVTKAGSRVPPGQPLAVERKKRFVSSAGEKLDAALEEFGVRVAGRVCIDAGASTGGFTDVLLRRGAGGGVAGGVGYGQPEGALREGKRGGVM